MGMDARTVRAQDPWDFLRQVKGWNRAQKGGGAPDPMPDDEFDALKRKYS